MNNTDKEWRRLIANSFPAIPQKIYDRVQSVLNVVLADEDSSMHTKYQNAVSTIQE